MPKAFGFKIDDLNKEEAIDRIGRLLKDGKQHYMVLPYSEFIVQAAKDKDFKLIIQRADMVLCEGRGLFFALRLLKQPAKEQIVGVDLVEEIAEKFDRVFLFGARPWVVEKAACNLGSHIIGFLDGYQGKEKAIGEINKTQPEILLVALGMPEQEKWITDNLFRMPSVKLAVGVGGSFDFISGRVKRAPKMIQRGGLEWLWRFGREPRRIKRAFRAALIFPLIVFQEWKAKNK